MLRFLVSGTVRFALPISAAAGVHPFPASFRSQEIATNGATIHVRVGGKGPAVVLLHGYGETGDMWAPMAADLARDHTVIVPDLRGLGLSSKPAGGFDKKTQARDIAGVLDALKISRTSIWLRTISATWWAMPLPPQHPERVRRFVLIDAPVPGIGPWEEILKTRCCGISASAAPIWSASSPGASASISTASGTNFLPTRIASTRRHGSTTPSSTRCRVRCIPALPSSPPSIRTRSTTRLYLAQGGKLKMPVLALGGEKSFGPMMATVMRAAAENVQEGIVPDSGHWIMEENPQATIAMVRAFLDAGK